VAHGGFVSDRLFLPLLLSHAYKDKDGQEAAIVSCGDGCRKPSFNARPKGRLAHAAR
jgi:hypothetical protein